MVTLAGYPVAIQPNCTAMLHVDLDNILTNDELATKADEVLRKTDDEGKIVVVTRNGRPAVAILKLEQLEELSGRTVSTNTPPAEFPGVTPPENSAPAAPEVPHEEPAPSTPPAPHTDNAPGSDLPDMPA